MTGPHAVRVNSALGHIHAALAGDDFDAEVKKAVVELIVAASWGADTDWRSLREAVEDAIRAGERSKEVTYACEAAHEEGKRDAASGERRPSPHPTGVQRQAYALGQAEGLAEED